jgi:phosphate starvation-inducible PhoH-like protein
LCPEEQPSAAAREPSLELSFENHRLFEQLLGQHDDHLKAIERSLGVRIAVSGTTLVISGDPVERELAGRVLTQLYAVVEKGYPVYTSDVDYAVRILSGDRNANLREIFLDTIYISAHKRTITPKSIAQKTYIEAIRNYEPARPTSPWPWRSRS